MRILTVIPARGGSKRLHRKNIYPLFGKPLMSYAIEACKGSQYLDAQNIYVSTEDEEIAGVAIQYGAKVIDRPDELAEDHAAPEQPIPRPVCPRRSDVLARKCNLTPSAVRLMRAFGVPAFLFNLLHMHPLIRAPLPFDDSGGLGWGIWEIKQKWKSGNSGNPRIWKYGCVQI